MLNENSIANFKANLRGRLIEPGDKDYDEARKVYNGMIHKKPRLIARCADVADVSRSVNVARENDLLLAIRSGGHNAGGLGICDNGLVIDLAPIKYTRVDPSARTVTVGGGCTWGDVDHATHVFGLATPSGIISTTGVGGLTLGGGVGHLTRKCGLTIDNLLSADVVLANGKFVKANPDENSDLFWAIRGGGGNFGVVTSFTFKLHPIDTIYGGPMFYELSETADVMKWYRDLIPSAPDDLNGFFAFLTVPPGPPFPEHLHLKKMCGVDPDPANNEKIIAWSKSYYDALHPYSAGGAYVNFMMDEGEERVKATYGDNYEQLVAIKNKYDPDNLFRVNQNIKPTKQKSAPAASS